MSTLVHYGTRMALALDILFVKLHILSGVRISSQHLPPHRARVKSSPVLCLKVIQKLCLKKPPNNLFHTQHYPYQHKRPHKTQNIGKKKLKNHILVIQPSNIISYSSVQKEHLGSKDAAVVHFPRAEGLATEDTRREESVVKTASHCRAKRSAQGQVPFSYSAHPATPANTIWFQNSIKTYTEKDF